MNHHERLLFHNLNLDYPKGFDYEAQTNYTLNKVMNEFISEFINSFEDTTFVVNYTDDTFGLITYNILLTIQSCYDIEFYLYGKNKKTKNYINKKYVIKKRKLKHLNNIIYIECFNPLYYVAKHKKYFNDLSIVSLISKFTPRQFMIMSRFYNIPDDTIYNTNYEEVASAYKKIFGSNKNVPLEDAETFYLSCYVRNNDYLCMAMDAGGGLESANEFKFVNATKQNNTITIYNLIVAESKLIEDKINIDNLSDKNWQKYGKKYKSVFKEDSDGNYYWYSTEPVEE